MNTSFEDRLLAELRQVVQSRPAPAPEASPRRTPPRRVGLTLGAGTAVAATAAAVVVLAGSSSDTPAYAVDRQDDGTVTVEINSLRDADGLERKLRAAGVQAEVDYTPSGKTCAEGRFAPSQRRDQRGTSEMSDGDGSTRFSISRGSVAAGETLVIWTSLTETAHEESSSIAMAVASGPVGPCKPVDAPAGLAPPGATSHSAAGGSGAASGPRTESFRAAP